MENKLVVIKVDHLYSLIKKAFNEVVIQKEESEHVKDLLSFKETCDFLGIHPSRLNNWKAENKIPYKRLGKRVFFEGKKF